MRTATHLFGLGALVLAAACSRGTAGGAPQPEPRQAPVVPSYSPPTTARLGIPLGHLPEIGQCRIWIPGVPPGRQRHAQSVSCLVIGTPPAGSWLLYRPTSDRRIVRVRVMDARRPGVITVVRLYRLADGEWMRDMRPDHEPRDEELYHVRPQPPPPPPPIVRVRPPPPPPPASDSVRFRIDTLFRNRRDTLPGNRLDSVVVRDRPDNPPGNRPDNPPGNRPDNPPGNRPDNPPGNRPDNPPGNRPDNPPGNRPDNPPAPPPPVLDLSPLDIPPGHIPNEGECRLWIPGTPPGRQPRPTSRPCAGLESAAPAASWIVYRPAGAQPVVHVRVMDAKRPGVVTVIRIFDADTKQLLREVAP